MLEIATATLQQRRTAFAGAFLALMLGTGIIAMMAQALAATFGGGSGGALTKAQSMAAVTGGIAVTVTVFIVISTFAFTVEQRSRELALLRLVGATPSQVRRMIMAESGLLAAPAALAGCVLGVIGSGWLNLWMTDQGIAPDWFHIGVNPIALIVAWLLGTASALIGSAAVALRASRIAPVSALREAAVNPGRLGFVRWLLGVGFLAAAAISGYVIATGDPAHAVNPRKYAVVPLLYVIGFALLAPLLLRPLARLCTLPFTRRNAGALLVRQNTLNAGRRVAGLVTPAVLAVGLVAAVMCMQSGIDSTQGLQPAQTYHARYVAFDGTLPASGALSQIPITIGDARGDVLDTLNGKAVAPTAMGTTFTPLVLQGSLRGLGDDFIVVDERTASGDGISLGQVLTVWLPDHARLHMKVGAIVQTGLNGDDTWMSDTSTGAYRPSIAWVNTVVPGVRVQTAAAYFAASAAAVHQQNESATRVILGITVGYALLAMMNTLNMAAAGRRREYAALQLNGATRAQILRMTAAESLLTVIAATILAVAAGAAVIATQRLALTKLIHDVPVITPWTDLWQAAVLCAVLSALTSVVAARQALRHRAIEAVALLGCEPPVSRRLERRLRRRQPVQVSREVAVAVQDRPARQPPPEPGVQVTVRVPVSSERLPQEPRVAPGGEQPQGHELVLPHSPHGRLEVDHPRQLPVPVRLTQLGPGPVERNPRQPAHQHVPPPAGLLTDRMHDRGGDGQRTGHGREHTGLDPVRACVQRRIQLQHQVTRRVDRPRPGREPDQSRRVDAQRTAQPHHPGPQHGLRGQRIPGIRRRQHALTPNRHSERPVVPGPWKFHVHQVARCAVLTSHSSQVSVPRA
jgi:putative ABC transport system permease protein